MIKEMALKLVAAIGVIGYPGIVLFMAIESSFIPFPSEIIVPPAGYHAAQGKMHLGLVILAGLAGSMIGAYINYAIAVYAGRPFIIKYGRYFLITEEKLKKCEDFFSRHGEITTFVGRLIPAIRQLISFPAGLARMNLLRFSFYTALGAGTWTVILALFGYWVGRNQTDLEQAWKHYSTWISLGLVVLCVVVVGGYVLNYRRRQRLAEIVNTDAHDDAGVQEDEVAS